MVQSNRGRKDIRVKLGCLTCRSTAPKSPGPTLTHVCTCSILTVGGEAHPGTGDPEQGRRMRPASSSPQDIPGESQGQPRAPGPSHPRGQSRHAEEEAGSEAVGLCDLERLRLPARPEDSRPTQAESRALHRGSRPAGPPGRLARGQRAWLGGQPPGHCLLPCREALVQASLPPHSGQQHHLQSRSWTSDKASFL